MFCFPFSYELHCWVRQTNSPNLREAQQHTDEVECARVLEAKGLSARTQRFLLPDVERSFIVPSSLHRTHVGKANLDDPCLSWLNFRQVFLKIGVQYPGYQFLKSPHKITNPKQPQTYIRRFPKSWGYHQLPPVIIRPWLRIETTMVTWAWPIFRNPRRPRRAKVPHRAIRVSL